MDRMKGSKPGSPTNAEMATFLYSLACFWQRHPCSGYNHRMVNSLHQPDSVFEQNWLRFNANLGALWVFSREIVTLADRIDRERVREMAQEFAPIFGNDPAEVENGLLEFVPELDSLEIYPDFQENAGVREMLEAFRTTEFTRSVLSWAFEHPAKAHKLADIFRSSFSEPSTNGILLRRSALIQLVGFFELFIEDLFFTYYFLGEHEPSKNGDTRKTWARQEAEKLGKGGWKKRIENLQTLGIELGPVSHQLDELMEITQRRNLLVHNDGVIDSDFLQRIPERYRREKEWKPGQMLLVSTQYLFRAFDVISLFGCILHQNAWRKWAGTNLRKANRRLIEIVYASLKQKRYDLVCQLADYSEMLSLPRKTEQLLKINQAIAFREKDDTDHLQKIITELSDSDPGFSVQVAISVLRKDYKNAKLLLMRAVHKKQLKQLSKEWPLFDPIRDERWFHNILASVEQGVIPQKR